MVRINADVDQHEYDQLLKLRGNGTWRELLLTTLNIPYKARDRGRPPRHAFDDLYKSVEERMDPKKKKDLEAALDSMRG